MHGRDVLRVATAHAVGLAIACLMSYWFATYLLMHLLSVSPADDLLGGMWAVIATVFVYRMTIDASAASARSRVAATLVSFLLCQLYLVVLPFSAWGMVALIGIGSVILTLLKRPDDVVTAGITTTVIMVAAGLSSADARLQPVLRLIDTAIGVAVGVLAARLASLRLLP